MLKISFNAIKRVDPYWLVYLNGEGQEKHVYLPGCANNFAAVTGAPAGDEKQIVGWRYEKDGVYQYELICAGHMAIIGPARPGALAKLLYKLQGKDPQEAHREKLLAFEKRLNENGWKTLEKA